MKNKNLILIGLILLGMAALALLFFYRPQNKTPDPIATPDIKDLESMLGEVVLSESGFEPTTVTIKKGMSVVFKNRSGREATVNSDDYPSNKLYPFLNLGRFDDGSAVQAKFEEVGTYTYHNHLIPQQGGTVIVE